MHSFRTPRHSTANTAIALRLGAAGLALILGSPGKAAASQTVTVEGRLFYNDLRVVGHPEWRRDPDGNVGEVVPYSPTAVNLLAAWYVVADIFELDTVDTSNAHPNCQSLQLLGSATINYWGEYSFTEDIADDPCQADGDGVPDIGVRFRLRFCNGETRCFSLEDDGQTNYRLWHRHAQPSQPLRGSAGLHTLADGTFQAAPYDDYAKAANLYAGIVEATDVFHMQTDIPFYTGGEAELFVRFPSSTVTVPSTTSGHQLHYPQVNAWIAGGYHEFGHSVHDRAWEGTTGACGDCPEGQYGRDGDDTWLAISREYPHTALTEGWANFVSRVIENWPDGCGDSFDENDSTLACNADPNEYPQSAALITHADDGKSYARNVTKLLCDWYDDGAWNDDDPNLAGAGDHFTASLESVWSNLENMWDWSGGAAGLEICDYVDYYLNERKSVASVGQSAHDDYVEWITDLTYNNGLTCGLTAPLTPALISGVSLEDVMHVCKAGAACADDRVPQAVPIGIGADLNLPRPR